jgi:hypothetical protein
VVGVSAKVANVLLHPLERRALVPQAVVIVAILRNLLAGEEAVDAVAVVHGDNHDALVQLAINSLFLPALLDHLTTVTASGEMEATAGDVHQNRQIITRLSVMRREDIQTQAILGVVRHNPQHIVACNILAVPLRRINLLDPRTHSQISGPNQRLLAPADAVRAIHRLRPTEPIPAARRSRIGDIPVRAHLVRDIGFDGEVVELDDVRVVRVLERRGEGGRRRRLRGQRRDPVGARAQVRRVEEGEGQREDDDGAQAHQDAPVEDEARVERARHGGW